MKGKPWKNTNTNAPIAGVMLSMRVAVKSATPVGGLLAGSGNPRRGIQPSGGVLSPRRRLARRQEGRVG